MQTCGFTKRLFEKRKIGLPTPTPSDLNNRAITFMALIMALYFHLVADSGHC